MGKKDSILLRKLRSFLCILGIAYSSLLLGSGAQWVEPQRGAETEPQFVSKIGIIILESQLMSQHKVIGTKVPVT